MIARLCYALSILNLALIVPLLISLSMIILNEQAILRGVFQSLVVLGAILLIKARIQSVIGAEINTVLIDDTYIWESIGAALIGIAVLGYALLKPPNVGLKRGHVWMRFGGIFALIVYLGYIKFQDEYTRILVGRKGITEVNPIVVLLIVIVSLVYIVGRPLWLLWTGRTLLKYKE